MQPEQPVRPQPADEPEQGDGVLAVAVGTALWGVALLLALAFRGRLRESGAQWWVWTCATGFALGLFGCWWVRRRRARLASAAVRRTDPD